MLTWNGRRIPPPPWELVQALLSVALLMAILFRR